MSFEPVALYVLRCDGRVHCKKHVAGTADMAEAMTFGLPFEAAQQEGEGR